MRTSKQIIIEIEERFGFLPPFFKPVLQNPQVLENLWQQTLLAYIDNPLPALFKEKLFAYLSHYFSIPYCTIYYSCNLRALGMKALEVLDLLKSPPPTETDIDEHLKMLAEQTECLTFWQKSNPALEESLLYCSIFIALEQGCSKNCRQQLHQILGPINYQHLVTFTTYIKTCHGWMEAYPEVAYEADKRAIDYLDQLLEDESSLVDFFRNYQEVRREHQSRVVQRAELNERERSEAALRQSEARYQALVKATAQVVWTTNAEGHVVDDLPSWQSLTGQSWEVMQGWGWLNAIHPDDRAETARQWTQAVATKGIYEIEHRVRLVDGSYRFFLARGVPVLDLEGKILEWVGTHTDITAYKQTQGALHHSQTRFQRLIENMPGMVYSYLPCANGPDQFTFVNSASDELLELEPEMVLQDTSSFVKLIHPDDLPSFQESVVTSAQNFLPWRWEGRIITRSGQLKWIQGISRLERTPEEGDVWDGLLIDITERKQAEEQLVQNAFFDSLTGLANRTLFMERLEQAVEQAKWHKDYLFAVLFLDLDRFKVINDSLGHLLGDQLLSAIANRLTACLRPTDTLARLGGDEFTLLIENIQDASDALRVAKRLQAELSIPFELDGQKVFTSASIGIALSGRDLKSSENILRDADIAMYRAKSQGAARYEIFNTQMHAQAVARLQLETELRLAVEQQEFRIYYQPIVELATSFLVGFEALVRWQHPTRGLISPTDFMPVALETELCSFIDQWVLAQACCQAQQWQEQYPHSQPLTISVNVCSSLLAQPELIEQIKQILLQTGLDARSLKLEITEDAIMENEAVTSKFAQLQAMGIRLSIDDFGTGYSSLSRLHQFPISILKIDRSFISRLGQNSKDVGIVEATVTLGQKLGIEVIAEGVETLDQLQKLRELKCRYGQGYLFSQPLDSDAAELLVVGCVADDTLGMTWEDNAVDLLL